MYLSAQLTYFYGAVNHRISQTRVQGIKWEQVMEEKIVNEEALTRFHNIPETDAFIMRRTNMHIGKVIRTEKTNLPKLLWAWIYCLRKKGHPQNSCNNNFLIVINSIIPEVGKMASSKTGLPLLVMRAYGTPKIIFFADSMPTNPDEISKNAEP